MNVHWIRHPHSCSWWEINPATHPFDASAARKLVDDVFVRLGEPTASSGDLDAQMAHARRRLHEIQAALVRHVGSWTEGWLWSGAGGPVRAAVPYRERATTADGVVASLVSWRTFLEELALVFTELRKEVHARTATARDVEAAAARLLPFVIRHTTTDDRWFGTLATVLRWYLEDGGYSNKDNWQRLEAIIDETLDGRFESWIQPEQETARLACLELGENVERICNEGGTHPATQEPPPIDGMALWIRSRATLDDFKPQSESEHQPLRVDGHRAFIRIRDRARDADRADRMEVALDMCRAWAASNELLTFDHLASWQAIVLGLDSEKKAAEFRDGDAYAKGGREIYPLKGARAAFEAGLADANDTSTPLPMRAVRAYFDVCFFHPFADGNGRAARLVLDALLTRAGYGLHTAEPLFILRKHPESGESMAQQVDLLMGPSASR